jgi:hypothetical protein
MMTVQYAQRPDGVKLERAMRMVAVPPPRPAVPGAMRLALCVSVLWAIIFGLGVAMAPASESVATGLFVTATVIGIVGTLWSAGFSWSFTEVNLLKNPLISTLIGLIALEGCAAALVLGEYLPHELELWGLSVEEYGSDDNPGRSLLYFNLFVFAYIAALPGILVGFLGWAVFLAADALKERFRSRARRA